MKGMLLCVVLVLALPEKLSRCRARNITVDNCPRHFARGQKYIIWGWVICRVIHPEACRRVNYSANYSPEDYVFARGQLPRVIIYEMNCRSRISLSKIHVITLIPILKSLIFYWSTWRIEYAHDELNMHMMNEILLITFIMHSSRDESRSVIGLSCKDIHFQNDKQSFRGWNVFKFKICRRVDSQYACNSIHVAIIQQNQPSCHPLEKAPVFPFARRRRLLRRRLRRK